MVDHNVDYTFNPYSSHDMVESLSHPANQFYYNYQLHDLKQDEYKGSDGGGSEEQ